VKEYSQSSRRFYTDKGNISGAVYISDQKHWDFIAEIQKETILTNPLHIDEFLWLTQMEAQIIRWTLEMYNGDLETCGVLTSGGTESNMLAVLAYRVQALKERGIT
jgi:sphinganine-1-phosphate aldolase